MPQSYSFRFWRAADRWLNAVTGGDDEETISHRVARAQARGVWWGRAVCWSLDKVGYVSPAWRNHCDKVLTDPNKSDATVPVDAPFVGDANRSMDDDPRP